MGGMIFLAVIMIILSVIALFVMSVMQEKKQDQKSDSRIPRNKPVTDRETEPSKEKACPPRSTDSKMKSPPKTPSSSVPAATAPSKKEIVCLTNYYSYKASNLNERIIMEDRYIVLDTETGGLSDEHELWRDVVIRPGAMASRKEPISYDRMYELLDEYQVENADIFKQLTLENYREWLEQHRDIIFNSRFINT